MTPISFISLSFSLLFFFLFVSTSFSSTITLNPTFIASCSSQYGGCSLLNTSIYSSSIVPSSNDTLSLSLPEDFPSEMLPIDLYLPSDTTLEIGSLYVQDYITLEVKENANLGVVEIAEFSANSFLSISSFAKFYQLSPLNSTSSSFTLSANASLYILGDFSWNNDMIVYGNISTEAVSPTEVGTLSVLGELTLNSNVVSLSPSFPQISANIVYLYSLVANFPNGLSATQLTIFSGVTVNVGNIFSPEVIIMGTDSVINVNDATGFTYSISGSGFINFVGSIFTISNLNLNGSIKVTGGSVLDCQFCTVSNFLIQDTLYINASVVNNVTLENSVVTESFICRNGAVNIIGSVTITGPLIVDTSQLSLVDGASLTVSALSISQYSTIFLNGNLTSNVELPTNATLKITGQNGTIVGNLVNQGFINAATNRQLSIFGNLTLFPNGEVQAEFNSQFNYVISVHNNHASLSGLLKYTLAKPPFVNKVMFKVIELDNTTFTGSFANNVASSLSSSSVHRDLKIVYSSDAVFVEYKFSTKDVKSWMWVVLGVVLGIILVSTVAIVFKCRSSSEYEPIR